MILLAAGESSRFGSPKALADLYGEKNISRLQRIILSSEIAECIIVLGAAADQIKPYILEHTKVRVVYNKDYKLGQTSSFLAGLESIDSASEAIFLLPVDFAWIKTETINLLAKIFCERRPDIIVPVWDNQKGHPPVFSCRLRPELQSLRVDQGINQIIKSHAGTTVFSPVSDPGVVWSFNTLAELDRIKKAAS